MAVLSVYQPRDRKASPLWQIFNRCCQTFEDMYDEKFEKRFVEIYSAMEFKAANTHVVFPIRLLS